MAYSNGRIPDSALASISGVTGSRLRPGAASAWERLRSAVHAAHGWWPTPTGPTDAYRPYAVQESIFRARYTTSYLAGRPSKTWAARRWYLLPGKATAAVPGTSNHGLGITVDITGLGGFIGTRYKQLAAIAVPLGWSNAEGRSIGEAWHWTYTGPADAASNPGSSTGTVPDLTPTTPDITAPDLMEDWLMALTESEQRELLEAARYIKKGGEGANFAAEIPQRVTNILLQRIQTDAAFRDALGDALLSGKVSDTTGTLRQTTKDAREISRRTEIAVSNLTKEK